MSEGERQALALKLYDDWQETDTADSLEIYCYDKGRADAIDEFAEKLKSLIKVHKEYSECDEEYYNKYYTDNLTYTDIEEIEEQLKSQKE